MFADSRSGRQLTPLDLPDPVFNTMLVPVGIDGMVRLPDGRDWPD